MVQLIVRTYDDAGRPTGERVLGRPSVTGGIDPVQVFRNGDTENFWGYLDTLVSAIETTSDPKGAK
jgi:hypothetical protein